MSRQVYPQKRALFFYKRVLCIPTQDRNQDPTLCTTLQHTATHCKTLQHAAYMFQLKTINHRLASLPNTHTHTHTHYFHHHKQASSASLSPSFACFLCPSPSLSLSLSFSPSLPVPPSFNAPHTLLLVNFCLPPPPSPSPSQSHSPSLALPLFLSPSPSVFHSASHLVASQSFQHIFAHLLPLRSALRYCILLSRHLLQSRFERDHPLLYH